MDSKINNALPKVLVCYVAPWNDNGAQHSLAEIFSCWDKDRLALVYARAELPKTKYCDTFFRINENSVMKSVFNRKVKTSSAVSNLGEADSLKETEESAKEKKRYRNTSKRRNWFMVYTRELVWKSGKWKTEELDAFLDEFSPDIIFLPLGSEVYMARIQKYVAEYSRKPVVCYLTDDVITYRPRFGQPLGLLQRMRVRKYNHSLIKSSHRLFVISPKAKEEVYETLNVDSAILTKPIDFTDISFKSSVPGTPIKMVYTGVLSIGREKAICEIARAVAEINRDGQKISFEIYSGDTPKKSSLKTLNTGGCRFCGKVSREKVRELQNESDVVVFAESLSKRYREIARLSFSTKLTDYFASGRCIFALGSEGIAPIEYLKNEDAAVVVTRYEDIEGKLRELCNSPRLITEYGRKSFECGVRNHSADKVFGGFKSEMLGVYEKYKNSKG